MAKLPADKQRAYRERKAEQERLERLARDPRRTWPLRPTSVPTDFDHYPGMTPHQAATQASRDREWDRLAGMRAEREAARVASDLLVPRARGGTPAR